MTRLREALERARGERADADDASSDFASEAPAETTWQFDGGEDAPVPPVEADKPVQESRGVADEAPAAGQTIPSRPGAAKYVVWPNAEATLVEQFRRLAAALHHAQLQTRARTVMIASALEKEGKTLTATNLALTLSESYHRRVLLVDADLRRPDIHNSFQLDNRIGLGDVLKQAAPEGKLPVHQISPTLWVMTAGRPTSNPMGGLVSDTMKEFLTEAVEHFDWIVLDTPPVGLLSDANLLAAMIDMAVLVVNAKTTPYPMAVRAVDALGGSRVLGVVLNRADRSEVSPGYPYYSYSYHTQTDAKPARWRRFRLAVSRKG